MNITLLNESHVENVDNLGKKFRNTIGFLTRETLLEYLRRNRVLGAWASSGELAGYLLFADYPDRFRIAQLCVNENFRGQGIARDLIEKLKGRANNQKVIKLRCRRDFPAHNMWPKLGFIPLEERAGRSRKGLPLTLWCLRLGQDDELGLWKAEESDEVLDVVIDAQIFYDFDEPDSPKSIISKGLQNDFLVDSLNLWITDELFLEIDRHGSDEQRKRSIGLAQGLARVHHNQDLATKFKAKLETILPTKKPSQRSDIQQLAKTAASDIRVFVTKDEGIIQKAREIKALTGLKVLHPTELIISLHEETERQSYSPARVSGMGLVWKRLAQGELQSLVISKLCHQGESTRKLREVILSYLSRPEGFQCELLYTNGDPIAVRVLDRPDSKKLSVVLTRIDHSVDLNLFGQFVIADTLSISVAESREMVEFERENLSQNLDPLLLQMEFIETTEHFTRFTLSSVLTTEELETTLTSLAPPLKTHFDTFSKLSLEHYCTPVVSQKDIPCFLVPIQPTFAMGLLDRSQSADDLFGGDTSVLLRWENVYYRKKSRHKMLRAPARILWYVSGKEGAIVAISHLDEVEIDTPKLLFRKYQKFGILEWSDVYKCCGKDITQEIMALKFSRTFMFRHRVTLRELREVFEADGVGESLQSPSSIPFETFAKIFNLGFPNES